MSYTDTIIFYGNRHSPYSQRVEIAFKEVEVKFDEVVNIDLSNKPSWLKGLILRKDPSCKYRSLLPTYTPLRPAQIRSVIEYFSQNFISAWPSYMQAFVDHTQRQAYIEYVEIHYNRLDEMLRRQTSIGPYFLGNDYSLGDIAHAPFIARNLAINKGLLDGYIPKPITDKPHLRKFVNGILNRPSFKKTYIGDKTVVDDVAATLGIKSPATTVNHVSL